MNMTLHFQKWRVEGIVREILIVALKFSLSIPSDYVVKQTMIHFIDFAPNATLFQQNKTKYDRSNP